MGVSDSYLDFVIEQLADVKSIVTKRMFGGVGIYSDGVFFAVIDDDTLFLKVDETLAERHIARGMPPFAPIPGEKPMKSYYQVPVDVLEDAAMLTRWAKDSLAAIGAVRQSRAGRNRRTSARRLQKPKR